MRARRVTHGGRPSAKPLNRVIVFKSPEGRVDTAGVDELHSVDSLLEQAVALGASDLHITTSTAPVVRVRGDLHTL